MVTVIYIYNIPSDWLTDRLCILIMNSGKLHVPSGGRRLRYLDNSLAFYGTEWDIII